MSKLLERNRLVPALALLALAIAGNQAFAADAGKGSERHGWWTPNTVEVLIETNGAEALVGAVLYVEDAGILDFSLVNFLSRERYVLFAPTNTAFEALLGLDPGSLAGLSAADIAGALGDLVAADAVAAILLKHVVPTRRPWRADETSLLRAGSVHAVDGTELTVGVGARGVTVNDTTIIKANVRTRNSLIHFIDTVIL